MKNIFVFLFTLLCVCFVNKAMTQVVDSGTTGDCTWEITGTSPNYTLTISGNGAMENYGYSDPPWYSYTGNIRTLVIQQGVTTIGSYAFPYSSLTSVTIPNSVTTIGEDAFHRCSDLTSVTIPNSVTTIENDVFYMCNKLISISVDGSNIAYSSNNGVLFNKNQTILICCPAGTTGTYSIPNLVTTIRHYAFSHCSSLTSVTIPNSVTTIEEGAFSYCSGLTSVTIPNSVTTIGDMAFFYCISLTSVTIGNSVTTIGDQAFYNCSGLTSVTIPNSVTTIGDAAFSFCRSLTSVTIGNSVTTIEDYAFSSCSGLTSITIPNSVTTIGDYAFYNCSSLMSVTIGNSVTTIWNYVFSGCSSLKQITVQWDVPLSITRGEILDGINLASATLYVPEGTKALYEAAAVWKDFGKIVEDNGFPIVPQIISKIIPRQTDESDNLKIQARVQSKFPITEMYYRIDDQDEVSVSISAPKTDLSFGMIYSGGQSLGTGNHKFYMQFRNSEGYWSRLDESSFSKIALEAADITLTATVSDSLVRLQWNSVSGVAKYELIRDGRTIHTFDSESHPIDMKYADNPSTGNHTYKVIGYNGLTYSGKTSPLTTVNIVANNPTDISTTQSGTILGYIFDDNGVEIDGAVITFSHDNKKVSSQIGKYFYSGLQYGVKGSMTVAKAGYEFYVSYGSATYEITAAKPVVSVNWKGKKISGSTAVPQKAEIALLTAINKDLKNDRFNINEDNYLSFTIKNIMNTSWSGDIVLSLDKYDGETLRSSYEIGKATVEALNVNETKNIYIDVPANTITLFPDTYKLCLRSQVNTFIMQATKIVQPDALTVNSYPITLIGDKPMDLEYWEGIIGDMLAMVKQGNSYANAYTKVVQYTDLITGSYIQDMLLSEIIADLGKYTGDLLKLKAEAEKYINALQKLDEYMHEGVTEDNAFKMFCKVAGSAMKLIAKEYPGPAYIYGMYFEVLEKARDRIIDMGNNIFDNATLPFLMNEGAVCISVKVEREKYWGELWNKHFESSEVAGAISSATLEAISIKTKASLGKTPLNKCASQCCGNDDREVYFSLQRQINTDLDPVIYIMKIEWTNGRISYVPLTRDFAEIQGDNNNGEIKVEFKSESKVHVENTYGFVSEYHMANKIKIKYYGK